MEKFIKPFRGVPEGEIYPVEYEAGDDCPPELIAGARSVGALPDIPLTPVDPALLTLMGQGFQVEATGNEGVAPNSGEVSAAGGGDSDGGQDNGSTNAQEAGQVGSSAGEPTQDRAALIAALEAAEIPFDKRWGPEKLAAALASGKKE